MKAIIVVLLTLLITSCASGSYHNAPNNVSYECRKESTYQNYNASVNSYSGQASSGPQLNYQMMQSCIRARGYQIKEVTCWFGICPKRSF
jgi:hypothetical protein